MSPFEALCNVIVSLCFEKHITSAVAEFKQT